MPYPTTPHHNQQPYPQAVNLPSGMPPYPPNNLPQGGVGPHPYPNYNPAQQGTFNPYPPQPQAALPTQNSPYPPTAFPGAPSHPHQGGASPYPYGSEGKDNMGNVEYHEGPGKGLFSKSGLLGKAIDKGITFLNMTSDVFIGLLTPITHVDMWMNKN